MIIRSTNHIDRHVLFLESTDLDLKELCLKTLADELINIYKVQGVSDHIGKERFEGFRQGSAPYVSCIDPDDLVIPGAFQACLDVLEKNPEACRAYTDEQIIDGDGSFIKIGIWSRLPWNPLLQLEPKYLHHIYVMRRSFVEKYLMELLRWPNMPEYIFKCLLAAQGPWMHFNRFGYKWRLQPKATPNSMPLMTIYAARWRVIPTLQQAAKKYGAVLPAG